MTSQLISPVSSESSSVEPSAPDRSHSVIANEDRHLKSYQANQQVKYLHLQAEIEVLLQQLQTLKQKVRKPALKAEEN